MINPSEHFYDDDPGRGHPDVRTRLRGVSYFFVGNGLIHAGVQWAPGGEGTPLGLLVMDPERLRKKRESLTMDPERGLEPTIVRVCADGPEDGPHPETLRVAWAPYQGVPAAEAEWHWSGGEVVERFFCPDTTSARLVREVTVVGRASRLSFTRPGAAAAGVISLDPANPACSLIYDLDAGAVNVRAVTGVVQVDEALAASWAARPVVRFGHERLDRFWHLSGWQLSAAVARSGRIDASVWQYNREWVRDQALVALGFVMSGDHVTAGRILRRLLSEFVTADGGTVDSSEVRGRDEAELDQNGVLLYALQQYVLWTGDLGLVIDAWDRIAAVAAYPLRPEFAHPSGLLHNAREFWERHRVHGIEPGFELAHQLFLSMGWSAAAALARRTGRHDEALTWDTASARLRSATFDDSAFGFVVDGALVKRKRLDGTVQERIDALPEAALPAGVPLAASGAHCLDPDTCTVLPAAFGAIDPRSPVAVRTLDRVEALWNQAWSDGGYGRYHVSSEPDSPGGWPFASIFVARAALDAGRADRAWRVLDWLDRADGSPAGSWFEFYGRRMAPPFPQVGVVPWTWAELLTLLAGHVAGVRLTEGGVRIRPHLLPGQEHCAVRLAVRGHELDVEVTCGRSGEPPAVSLRIDGRKRTDRDDIHLLPPV